MPRRERGNAPESKGSVKVNKKVRKTTRLSERSPLSVALTDEARRKSMELALREVFADVAVQRGALLGELVEGVSNGLWSSHEAVTRAALAGAELQRVLDSLNRKLSEASNGQGEAH